MARFAISAAMVLTALTASVVRADSEIPDGVLTVADEGQVDGSDLWEALTVQAIEPTEHNARMYMCYADGLLCPQSPPVQVPSRYTRLADCIIQHESRGNPNAVNPVTKASGLGQFLGSTWRTTPQGKAGYSVFNPAANRAAVEWMLEVGRGKEFVGIRGC
jgi:hypothetical protein